MPENKEEIKAQENGVSTPEAEAATQAPDAPKPPRKRATPRKKAEAPAAPSDADNAPAKEGEETEKSTPKSRTRTTKSTTASRSGSTAKSTTASRSGSAAKSTSATRTRAATTRKKSTDAAPKAQGEQPQEAVDTSEKLTSGAAAQPATAQEKPRAKKQSTTQSEQVSHTEAQDAPKAEEPPRLSEAPASTLPVQAEPQRGLEIAVPPINFEVLGKERRNFWGRLLLLALVGVLLAASILIFVYRPTPYSSYSHSITFLYHADTDMTQILYDGKDCESLVAGKCTTSARDSSGRVCTALIGDTLYLVRGKKVTRIADNVSDFALSQNGRAMTYRTAEQKLFYVQLTSKLKTSTVSQDTRDARYCLSPDGKLLFYTYVEQVAEDEIKTRADVFSLSGEKPLLPYTTDVIPVAIADGYEHLFYLNGNGDLYHMDEDGEISICHRKGESEIELLFDREFDEVLIKDTQGIKLWQDGDLTVISALKGAENLTLLANKQAVYCTLPCAGQYLIRTFDENYYLKRGSDAQGVELVYLNGDELKSVAFVDETQSKIVVTDKGVYYLDLEVMSNEVRKYLYRCPLGQTTPVRLSNADTADFLVNSDGSRLLHTDNRGALYASRITGKGLDTSRVADTMTAGSLCVNASNAFYYDVEGTLYVSDNGNTPGAVKEQASMVYMDAHTAFLFVPEPAKEDGTVTYTVYSNYRNRRENTMVATGITIP